MMFTIGSPVKIHAQIRRFQAEILGSHFGRSVSPKGGQQHHPDLHCLFGFPSLFLSTSKKFKPLLLEGCPRHASSSITGPSPCVSPCHVRSQIFVSGHLGAGLSSGSTALIFDAPKAPWCFQALASPHFGGPMRWALLGLLYLLCWLLPAWRSVPKFAGCRCK